MVYLLSSASFSIPEMYDLIRGSSVNWGLEGYQVPKIDYDLAKMKKEREDYQKKFGKGKKDKQGPVDKNAKRGGIFDTYAK